MKFTRLFGLLCALFGTSALSAQEVQSPSDFLGYTLGSQFTYHHQVVDYFQSVAATSAQVKLYPYGESYEGRPLILAAVSSPENMAQLDVLRQANLTASGIQLTSIDAEKQVPIVWLSYNIHGNEAVSTEAAMATLYTLLTADTANWLKDMIVILDPCVNPDGRDRYTQWYRQVANTRVNPLTESQEHHEPWPGGRFNHYLFDLNRDWCWQSQQESQQRAVEYYRWMPHVHVDFHEMGANSPYFFGPAARPYHEIITDWQQEFQRETGKSHAHYFDQEGWLYFTKEIFDLFYPSYGDTWPTFHGAIGFTYEQGGSGRAGRALEILTGDTLTLSDRIAHHHTTGLSTIETAWKHRERLLTEFNQYFEDARKKVQGPYKSYIIKAGKDPARIQALLTLLDRNHIQYGHPNSEKNLKGYDFQQASEQSFQLKKEDIVISTYQSQGHLVQVLFEPEARLEDSLTYDLTAWSLPYAYDLQTYGCQESITPVEQAVEFESPNNRIPSPKPFAYLILWNDLQDVRFLSALLTQKIKVRYTSGPISTNGESFPRGSLLIMRTDNNQKAFDEKLIQTANAHQQKLTPLNTGFVDSGKDLGSNRVGFIKAPKIALINGDGVSPSSFGELWHYFEQDLDYPISVIRTSYLAQVELSKFDVLILPSGSYQKFQQKILTFARQGGKVIALEGAIQTFSGKNKDGKPVTDLAKAYEDQKSKEAKAKAEELKKQGPENLLKRFENQERSRLSGFVPGSIYKVSLDDSHPISFGLGTECYLIKRNRSPYPYLPEGNWNVGSFKEGAPVSGFTGYKLKKKIENSLAVGVEGIGQGEIIYMTDSPVFRSFWYSGKLLLGNAVFF